MRCCWRWWWWWCWCHFLAQIRCSYLKNQRSDILKHIKNTHRRSHKSTRMPCNTNPNFVLHIFEFFSLSRFPHVQRGIINSAQRPKYTYWKGRRKFIFTCVLIVRCGRIGAILLFLCVIDKRIHAIALCARTHTQRKWARATNTYKIQIHTTFKIVAPAHFHQFSTRLMERYKYLMYNGRRLTRSFGLGS